jgi:hypothetical protein
LIDPYQDSVEQEVQPFRFLLIFLTVVFAMIGSFGSWRRGLVSLGIGYSASFAVAVVADIVLIVVCLLNEAVWTEVTRVRLGGGSLFGFLATLGVRIGLVYLYGWISFRGGGSWWDLF